MTSQSPSVELGRWVTPIRKASRIWIPLLVAAVVIALSVTIVRNLTHSDAVSTTPGSVDVSATMPESAAIEDQLGIRFSRVAVVGDGGLVVVSYVVLDSEKAALFQADAEHPPVLRSESRDGTASRVALMKQGHTLRPGQQYYLVYQDPANLIRPGEQIDIDSGEQTLAHVPVV